MRKNAKIIIFSVSIVFAAAFACSNLSRADFSADKWEYYKDITTSEASSGLVEVSFDDEVLAYSKNDLSDIRIIDASNREIPYKVVSSNSSYKEIKRSPKLLDNSYVEGSFSSAVLDMGGNGELINNIEVITPSENFQRNVKINGSNDNSSWAVLKDNAYIYDYTDRKGGFKSSNASIDFPETSFRFIKIEISDQEKMPVKISSVVSRQITKESAREIERDPEFSISDNKEARETVIMIDNKISGIPTSKIEILTGNQNFNRSIYVYGSNENDDSKFSFIKQGYIFNYDTPRFSGKNTLIDVGEINKRYIKVVIKNDDNSPVTVSDIKTKALLKKIAFQSENGSAYRLFYGNKKANYPVYDIEKYFGYLDQNVAASKLSSQKENPGFVPEKEPEKPLSERIPNFFSIILVITSLMLLLVVYKFFKDQPEVRG